MEKEEAFVFLRKKYKKLILWTNKKKYIIICKSSDKAGVIIDDMFMNDLCAFSASNNIIRLT